MQSNKNGRISFKLSRRFYAINWRKNAFSPFFYCIFLAFSDNKSTSSTDL